MDLKTLEFKPRFLRQYLNLGEQIDTAIKKYVADVKSNDFPNASESY
jgi:3-methyl-2-oxobutanoate hydroxymethyltransferase